MSSVGKHWIHLTLDWIREAEEESPPAEVQVGIDEASAVDLESLVEIVEAHSAELNARPAQAKLLMQMIAARVVELARPSRDQAGSDEHDVQELAEDGDADQAVLVAPAILAALYEALSADAPSAAAHALQILALQSDEESLEALADVLTESPPGDWKSVGLALSPLWNAPAHVLEHFFEQIADGFIQPTTMAVLLDLANYSVRSERLASHPWTSRHRDLTSLLEKLLMRLRTLEKEPAKFGESVEEVQAALQESLALVLSLCDALGLIGKPDASACLLQALTLSHRRIQTEAAGALARLGDPAGKERLLALAEDRVARLRAIYYAEELGWESEIDAALKLPVSLAESELASWLASPEQFGFPPTDMELVDARTQYWPSYDEPQDCFLFRYRYNLPNGPISNIGIAGACRFAFHADLGNLPVDDIYAAFAGWHAEHEDIFEVPASQLNQAQQREVARMQEYLEEQDLPVQESIALTFFLGEVALLAMVEQDGKQLCAITDGQELLCYPVSNRSTSLTPDLVLCIYRGRKMLRTFNP